MSPKNQATSDANEKPCGTQRLDSAVNSERVITLATTADRHLLRGELLKLIIKNEARRKGMTPVLANQDLGTTEGSANSCIVEAFSS
jgi:hypothetical protein